MKFVYKLLLCTAILLSLYGEISFFLIIFACKYCPQAICGLSLKIFTKHKINITRWFTSFQPQAMAL